MSRAPKPDFDALRAERNAGVERMIGAVSEKYGWDRAKVHSSFDPDAFYCAYPDGPCEHDFQGWRELDDGLGGEQVCARCGMGAMAHGIRCGP